MTFGSPWSWLNFTVHQSDDPTVPVQAFEQRDLIHISAHRFRIGFVKRDPFDGIYLVRIVHYAVNARRTAFANQIEPCVRLFAHNEVACPDLCDRYMSYVVLACSGYRIRRRTAPVSYRGDWGARGRWGFSQLR
jgi:hypothetical protein